MKLVCNIKNGESITLQLKNNRRIIEELHLTISQDLDMLLIIAIDKLLAKNRIDRLSLKTFKILGEIRPEAVSSMIIKTIKTALEI